MEIIYRPMTADEAWNFISGRHRHLHQHLKHFGYGYEAFIPKHPAMSEMYEQETLTDEQKSKYRDIFMNEIYNEKDLRRLDETLEEKALPALLKVVDVLTSMAKKWGIEFPDKVEIHNTYGRGGSYWAEKSVIIYRMSEHKAEWAVKLLQHEFIHILIEIPIIQKYGVPQDLKERIVDIIGLEYFDRPVQKMFEDSFANKYITIEAIENDLPGAVEKMMIDYKNKS